MKIRSSLGLMLACTMLLGPTACKKKTDEIKRPTLAVGESVDMHHTRFKVLKFGFRYLLVNSVIGNYYMDEPFFVIEAQITNIGKARFNYSPEHYGRSKYYPELKEESGLVFSSVHPRQGQEFWGMQKDRFLDPGQSITDIFVYRVSRTKKSRKLNWLVRANQMLLERYLITVKLPYTLKDPEEIPFDDFTKPLVEKKGRVLVMQKPKLEYIRGKSKAGDTLRSNNPRLVFNWTVKNTGKKAFRYRPAHNHPRGQAAFLFDQAEMEVRRTRVGDFIIEGLQSKPTVLEPGKSITDKLVFKIPKPINQKHVILHLSKRMIGQRGVWRFKFTYDPTLPEKPKSPDEIEEEKKKKGKKGKKKRRKKPVRKKKGKK